MSNPYLEVTKTDRGFKHMPALPSRYGGTIRTYESSSAEVPSIWVTIECPVDLNDPTGPTKEAVAHLEVDAAWLLAEQLRYLVEHHYQGDFRPTENDGVNADG